MFPLILNCKNAKLIIIINIQTNTIIKLYSKLNNIFICADTEPNSKKLVRCIEAFNAVFFDLLKKFIITLKIKNEKIGTTANNAYVLTKKSIAFPFKIYIFY